MIYGTVSPSLSGRGSPPGPGSGPAQATAAWPRCQGRAKSRKCKGRPGEATIIGYGGLVQRSRSSNFALVQSNTVYCTVL
ncbi:unnamed protein product [Calypogeia fissa]